MSGIVTDVSEERDQPLVLHHQPRTGSARTAQRRGGLPRCRVIHDGAGTLGGGARAPDERAVRVLEADGLLAVCIQHEDGSPGGQVFVEYLSPLKRNRIKTKMTKLQRERSRLHDARNRSETARPRCAAGQPTACAVRPSSRPPAPRAGVIERFPGNTDGHRTLPTAMAAVLEPPGGTTARNFDFDPYFARYRAGRSTRRCSAASRWDARRRPCCLASRRASKRCGVLMASRLDLYRYTDFYWRWALYAHIDPRWCKVLDGRGRATSGQPVRMSSVSTRRPAVA